MPFEERRIIYSISEITGDLKSLIEDNFHDIWLVGEVSNLKEAASGHVYFTLKDEKAQISAVIFRGFYQYLKFKLEDGMQIHLHGRLSLYEPRGQYQIIADRAEPQGMGELQLAFEQLKAKLKSEGLFDPSHKKDLPVLPKKIALISSDKGAVIHDLQNVLRRRYPNIDILIGPVKVQGEGAAFEIASMIELINLRDDIDLMIVGRGGGSLEDLWAFNEELVCRAIFNSRIPVISAVGHETDITLSDFVADLRAPTPSAAAELAVPLKDDLINEITNLRLSLESSFERRLLHLKDKLINYKRMLRSPQSLIDDMRLRCDDAGSRLIKSQKYYFQNKTHYLSNLIQQLPLYKTQVKEKVLNFQSLQRELKHLSPMAPLKKGYSLVYQKNSKDLVRKKNDVQSGDTLKVKLFQDEIKVKVVN